jgi:hypothetical protein
VTLIKPILKALSVWNPTGLPITSPCSAARPSFGVVQGNLDLGHFRAGFLDRGLDHAAKTGEEEDDGCHDHHDQYGAANQ